MFPNHTDVNIKSIYSRVLAMVKAAERENESKLKQKRDRLFNLLSQENLYFEKELQEQKDRNADYDFKHRLKKMLDMKRKAELEHQQIVEQKKLQQQFENSMEMRDLISKNQLKESKLAQIEQIKSKAEQNEREKREKQFWYEVEMRAQQDKCFQDKIKEIEQNQRNREIVDTLEKQIANKIQSIFSQKTEAKIESEFLHRKMEQCKLSDKQRKLKKFKEAEQWKKDLQRQIEYRRMKRDVERSRAIESEKQWLKYIESEMAIESMQRKSAKQLQHQENLKFFDYTQKVKSLKNELELKPIVADDQMTNETAAVEHAKQKQTLRELEMAAYNDALKRKQYEIMVKADENALDFAKMKSRNEEYNRRMAEEKYQNTLRTKRDLEKQIEEKNRQTVAEIKQHRTIQASQQCMDFPLQNKVFNSTPKIHPFHWSLSRNK